MIRLLWFFVLCLNQIFICNAQSSLDCSDGFTNYEGVNVCLLPVLQINQMEPTCSQRGATVFTAKMSDKMYEKFGRDLKKLAVATSEMDLYIGMKKKQSFGSSEKIWEYSNDQGSIDEKKFPYWERDPRDDEDCGVMKAGNGFKVTPYKCSQGTAGLCEKTEKPCFHQQMLYTEYYGRCLSQTGQNADYGMVKNLCYDGFIIPVTDDDSRENAAAALHTMPAAIYAGLVKKDDKWVYLTGDEEENERFAKGGPGEMDCGVYGLNREGEIQIFTASCENKLRGICLKKANSTES